MNAFDEVMTEREWQNQVIALARTLGWTVYAVVDTGQRDEDGRLSGFARRTHRGYPDLTMWRERILWAELKGPKTTVTAQQRATLAALKDAGGEVYLWRPKDFDETRAVLEHIGRPA